MIIIDVLVLLSNVFCIGMFLYCLKYIRNYGLILWGIFLFLDIIFIGLAELSHKFLLTNISREECLFLFEDVLMLFGLGIELLLCAKFMKIKPIVLIAIFIAFMGVWLTEFALKSGQTIVKLNITEVFSQVLTVALAWYYLLELSPKSLTPYHKTPFFWIVMGWLISSAISAVLFIPDMGAKADVLTKEIVGFITGMAQIIAPILYAIGFWKTKNWTLENPQG